jgi:hypothetical protein
VLDFALSALANRENVVIATAGWAFKFAPMFGKVMAELAIKGESTWNIAPMSITRPGAVVDLYPGEGNAAAPAGAESFEPVGRLPGGSGSAYRLSADDVVIAGRARSARCSCRTRPDDPFLTMQPFPAICGKCPLGQSGVLRDFRDSRDFVVSRDVAQMGPTNTVSIACRPRHVTDMALLFRQPRQPGLGRNVPGHPIEMPTK